MDAKGQNSKKISIEEGARREREKRKRRRRPVAVPKDELLPTIR
jgi:hypothetical protein